MLEPIVSTQLPTTCCEAKLPLDFTGDLVQWENPGAYLEGLNPSSSSS